MLIGRFCGRNNEAARAEQRHQSELAHAERIKALEVGASLPEVELARLQASTTQAKAEAAKAIVASIMRAFIHLGSFGVATGATALVLHRADTSLHLPALAIIWTSAAAASVMTMFTGALDSHRSNLRNALSPQPPLTPAEEKRLMTAIQK